MNILIQINILRHITVFILSKYACKNFTQIFHDFNCLNC